MTPDGDDANPEPDEQVADVAGPGEDESPQGFERWRRESAVGAVGTGIARGLQAVFAPQQDPPAIVAAVPGDPPNPEGLKVVLDPDDPSKSVVIMGSSEEDGDPPARP